jgi:hypothetical protein
MFSARGSFAFERHADLPGMVGSMSRITEIKDDIDQKL